MTCRKFGILAAALFLVVALTGCPKDARIKRAASMSNVKTRVATKEFNEAATKDEKIKIAEEYFRNAWKFTQVIDDYLHGREPMEVKAEVVDTK